MNGEIVVVDDVAAEFGERVIEAFHARPNDAFALALSGGGTARRCYEHLASTAASQIDWWKVDVYWGDERCVPPDDPRSNYGAARDALLDRVPIPCEQIHRMRGEDPNPEREAVHHEAVLRTQQGLARGETPHFDFAFLGLGGDAHVASLFPGSPTIALADRLVAAVPKDGVAMPQPVVDRLTLTFPALAGIREAVFVVAGEEKAAALRAVIEDPADPVLRPASGVRPAGGPPAWLVDRAAAALLSHAG